MYETYESLKLISNLEDLPIELLSGKVLDLPNNTIHSHTVIFDLDETLVHCSDDHLKS